MITKRNGHGQTECKRCKDNGKWSLTWDSFLYNFNDKPYCFECLMEMLEESQQIIDELEKWLKTERKRLRKSIKPINDVKVDMIDTIHYKIQELKGSDDK